MTWYHVVVAIHLFAAMVWLGGTFFLALVGAPVLRKVEPPPLRARLFTELGVRFRWVGWTSIAVLVATGTIVLSMRGVLHWSILGSSHFWSTPFGTTLAVKLVSVLAMITTSALHDFWLGKASAAVVPGSPASLRLRRVSALLARAAALIGIVIVVAAVRLAR